MATFYTQANADNRRARDLHDRDHYTYSPGQTVFNSQIRVGWNTGSNSVYSEGTTWTWFEEKRDKSYIRFEVSGIPQGSNVSAAQIRIRSFVNTGSVDHDIRIGARDSSNPSTITSFAGIFSPTNQLATGSTFQAPYFVADDFLYTPSVQTIVQSLVDSYDYTSTKHMLFFFSQTNKVNTLAANSVQFRAHGATNPPELVITFTEPESSSESSSQSSDSSSSVSSDSSSSVSSDSSSSVSSGSSSSESSSSVSSGSSSSESSSSESSSRGSSLSSSSYNYNFNCTGDFDNDGDIDYVDSNIFKAYIQALAFFPSPNVSQVQSFYDAHNNWESATVVNLPELHCANMKLDSDLNYVDSNMYVAYIQAKAFFPSPTTGQTQSFYDAHNNWESATVKSLPNLDPIESSSSSESTPSSASSYSSSSQTNSSSSSDSSSGLEWADLMFHMPFDNAVSSPTYEKSPNHYSGTVGGGITKVSDPVKGDVWDFDGSAGAYIDFGDIDAFDGLNDFTVACWFYSDTEPLPKNNYHHIFGKWHNDQTTSSFAFIAKFQSTGKARGMCRNGGSFNRRASATTIDFTTSPQWHHMAYTRSGTTQHFYLDGVLDDGVSNTGLAGATSSSTHKLYVGFASGAKMDEVVGRMKDLYMFSRELTADEINDLMRGEEPIIDNSSSSDSSSQTNTSSSASIITSSSSTSDG